MINFNLDLLNLFFKVRYKSMKQKQLSLVLLFISACDLYSLIYHATI